MRDLHLAILRDQLPAPAPAGPAATVPAQLPLDVHDFTGRTEQLEALDAVALNPDQPSAVIVSAVSGTAGVGTLITAALRKLPSQVGETRAGPGSVNPAAQPSGDYPVPPRAVSGPA